MSLSFRNATLHDIPLLRRWDEQPHVLAADPNHNWSWEEDLSRPSPWREQFIAEADGRPVGFLQILNAAREESHYWGDVLETVRAIDIWIGEPTDLNRGFGTVMMSRAIARCFSDPQVTEVWVDPLVSNTRARRFYERLGFRFLERRRFGIDECAVYSLERAQHERLRSQCSGALP